MSHTKAPAILIVEKEPDTRELIRSIASSLSQRISMTIVEANDGIKAEFKAANQKFHLVVTAMNLGGKDGLYLLKALKKMDPKNRPNAVILLTDTDFDEKWRELFSPLYFVKKPCEGDELRELLITALSLKPQKIKER